MSEETNENNLIRERKKKLEEIKNMGINPYPYSFKTTHHSSEILKKYSDLEKESKTKDKVSVAGRIMAMRKMGKAAFLHIQDQSGKVQGYFREDELGKDNYALFKQLDIGDFIGINGTVFKTKTGETTIQAKSFMLLCKSLRPLPEKYHGLKDDEVRFRKRYLDLMMSPEIKEVFIKRAKIYKAIRDFLDSKGYIEVQTPILQTQYGGANAKPFITKINAYNMPMYLRIAYELHLKRLLVGGLERVYDLSSCFRNEGVDRTHNPEFAMMEIQTAYGDYDFAMKLTEELWEHVAMAVNGSTKVKFGNKEIDLKAPWKRLTMKDAIKKFADINVDRLSDDELKKVIREHDIDCEPVRGIMIAAIFEELCEEKIIQPTHITDHPKETCPLAKEHRKDSELIERVEPFINGWEVANCYSELIDPAIQKEHLEEQAKKGRGGDEEAHPMDTDYIEALEYGLPPNTGIGIGVDRMVMLLTGKESIREVLLFPVMKPTGAEIKTFDTDKNKNLGIDRKKAYELLEKYIKDDTTRAHCIESEAIMREVASHLKEDIEKWGIIGLLHDLDWELTKDNTKEHCIKVKDILKKEGGTDFLIETIVSHGYGYEEIPEYKDLKRQGNLQHLLAASETLTGLIIAASKVRPDKDIANVKLSSLKKRFKEKRFAANCDREIIKECEKAGIELDRFLELGLTALIKIKDKL